MKIITLALTVIISLTINAQQSITNYARKSSATLQFNPQLEPFYHGVASGDPLQDRVIIWTRVTPPAQQVVTVTWEMATDTTFNTIINSGSTTTDMLADYTVKIDVTGLNAGTYYYYRFNALGKNSLTGRTKTAEAGNNAHLRFAVASCNNYQAGYFNGFGRIAERNDLDAVVHLGDFIYEYEEGGYGWDSVLNRGHAPAHEILSLNDYRTRHSFYRLDDDLRNAMQQHPFINVWDDHETANDAYKDGAQNHQAAEGSWGQRKSIGKQVFFEWLPIRENIDTSVIRSFDFGNLADLIMLDTRLEGREMQLDSFNHPMINDTSRTILGSNQLNWLQNELSGSSAQWKIIGNQVVFSELLLANFEPLYPGARNAFLDVWNGYPQERYKVIDFITNNSIDNTVVITGDVHSSFGFDISRHPGDSTFYGPNGMGSVAVEFITPSITSANFDENVGATATAIFEQVFPQENPHNKFVDLDRHGYMILDVTASKAQADWFYVNSIDIISNSETYGGGTFTNNNNNYLQLANSMAAGKSIQAIPAPNPLNITSIANNNLSVFRFGPNPSKQHLVVEFALNKQNDLQFYVADVNGKKSPLQAESTFQKGYYNAKFNIAHLANGHYFFVIQEKDKTLSSIKFIKQ